MAKYNGTVELIGGLTPKNNGTFPLVNAKDIQVDDNGTRLDTKLAEISNSTGGGVVTVTVDSMSGTASHNAAEIYALVLAGNAVVALMDGVHYQYIGATHFADDGACDTVEFCRTDVNDNGTLSSVYISIYDDSTTDATYNEATGGGGGIHIGEDAPTNGEILWVDTDDYPDESGGGTGGDSPSVVAVTPNWNANEGEGGYIENRTHYVDASGVVHKLPNKFIDADWMATSEDGGAGKVVFIPEQTVSGGMWSDIQADLVEGDKYAVEVNGVLYECECHIYDGTLYLGNGTLLGGTEGNNEPFAIAFVSGATSGMFFNDGTLEAPIGIKVSNWVDVVYNKLPEEFLPDNVVKGEGGKVHMDDVLGGVSWDNVSGKPFGEGAGEPFFEHTATFATDTAAQNGVLVSGASVTAILDTVYWLDVNGELLKCHWERNSLNSNLYDEDGNLWVTNTFSGVYVKAPTAGTYTYTLYAPSDGQMIDPQYLPPNLAKKTDIPDENGNVEVKGSFYVDISAGDEYTCSTKISTLDALLDTDRLIVAKITTDTGALFAPLCGYETSADNSYGRIVMFALGMVTFTLTPTSSDSYEVTVSGD